MTHRTPQSLLTDLVESRSRGAVAAALACYEAGTAIVTQPGQIMRGQDAVRGVLEFFAASRAAFTVVRRVFVEGDGVATHVSQWTLIGADPTGAPLNAEGQSADVARRQPDGTWLIAVDNPWGSMSLKEEERS